jgi:hypothetical protein
MYIGIKYEQILKNVNKQLNSFGSALMLHGKLNIILLTLLLH